MEVTVRDDQGTLGVFELTGTLRIGRDASNDIVLPFEQISRHHAALWEDGQGAWLQDLGSTNGTFVDGRRLGLDAVRIDRDSRRRTASWWWACGAGAAWSRT